MSGAASTKAARRPRLRPVAGGGAALGLLPWPKVDFTKFGPVERKDLSRIKKISGANLHRNWVMIPHVTNNDEADITELEAFRVSTNKENEKSGVKVTMLAFVIKAVVAALKKFPDFNASSTATSSSTSSTTTSALRRTRPMAWWCRCSRTPTRRACCRSARKWANSPRRHATASSARPTCRAAACRSARSAASAARTSRPIINAPEVAILGLSKGQMKPVWDGKQFVPRLTLPLSLSYDHRVIDGALAARFNAYLGQVLADYRRILL
jgi:pyruvate dehydrogenase E2 component (dihydrolipoamide acetyltransferase)